MRIQANLKLLKSHQFITGLILSRQLLEFRLSRPLERITFFLLVFVTLLEFSRDVVRWQFEQERFTLLEKCMRRFVLLLKSLYLSM